MRAAFEAKYLSQWDDPTSAEMAAVWADAWDAATAVGRLSRVWMVNGRLVAKTLSDPDVRHRVQAACESLRQDPEKLLAHYISAGVLTPDGEWEI